MIDNYINELYEYFQLKSHTCFISENNYLTTGSWEITDKFSNEFRGHIFLEIDENSKFKDAHISESDKCVLDNIVKTFDNTEYKFQAETLKVSDAGVSF